ncbi:eukaryotic translation initiation factor 3 subunit I-like [Sycon ciliatum]|uniref:eukaryotic translation initiation factor 3 subunit I-like n=1 Tax=Sycon ciliatum TaxID=27933 RepID=UPI0020A8D87C|eukprot:scpid80988/ scgid7577/ Eukaryotic translation initiation factor 3 subunit I; Eukaryotic translation initiation factor 3 subunit 2; eIF-3-beta; eIF3 p36
MKPLMLHGHERSITQIKYNRDGDLLFSTAKDPRPTVWFSQNGERLGTFEGHNGAVWCVDVSWDSRLVLTGAADSTARIWNCETGTQLHELKTFSAVRACGFSYSGSQVLISTDSQMGKPCELSIFDINRTDKAISTVTMPSGQKITAALWGPLDQFVITGHEDGSIRHYSIDGKLLHQTRPHTKAINSIQNSLDSTMIITASKDNTAKLFDSSTLEHRKTYKTERPVNSAALSSLKHHVVLGGGQEAMDVTTTSTRIGKFDARFFHMVFEEEIGRVKGHFGPINSVAFHPSGKSYCSGGEDGYVRIHSFDSSYFDFDFEH